MVRLELILVSVFLISIGTVSVYGKSAGSDIQSGRINEINSKSDELVIHGGVTSTGSFFFNVKYFGATGNGLDDDSEAIQEALTNAGNSGQGVVYLPEGTYLLKNPVSWERLSGSNALAGLVIRGDGVGKSVILVDNETGGFRLDDFFSNTQFQIKDMTIIAGRPGAGTAISVGKHGNRSGARGYRCFFSENIDMKGQFPADYFDKGIDVLMTYRPLYRNIAFTGSTLPGNEFLASVGIATDWCHTPEVEDCEVRNVHTAYSYLCSPSDSGSMRPEGGAFHKNIADNCVIGIDVDKPGNMPELVINYCNIRARDVGMRIRRIKFYQIRNNIIEPLVDPATHEFKDISTLGSFMGVYHFNIFKKFGIHSSEEELRTCLSFDDLDWRNDNSEMIIMNNLFPGTGTAVGGTQLSQMESSSIIKGNSVGTNLEAGRFRKFMYENYHVHGYPIEPELTGPVFSVLDFGAQENDLMDDADAFQDAIYAVIHSGGGILYIPAGKYFINKKIEIELPESTAYRKIV
ncbi:MAG: hypothetical protein K9G38_06580, partial [Bacteroidales bacterium]|nr:hypothetical protein [Bacteroidales bacterium]